MPVIKNKKIPKNNYERYSPRAIENHSITDFWKTWGSLVAILFSFLGILATWSCAARELGKIEQEFRDSIENNKNNISDLKKKYEDLYKGHHELTVEFNIQKTKVEFLDKDQKDGTHK